MTIVSGLYQPESLELIQRIAHLEVNRRLRFPGEEGFDFLVKPFARPTGRPGVKPEKIVSQNRLAALLFFRLIEQPKEHARVVVEVLVVEIASQVELIFLLRAQI